VGTGVTIGSNGNEGDGVGGRVSIASVGAGVTTGMIVLSGVGAGVQITGTRDAGGGTHGPVRNVGERQVKLVQYYQIADRVFNTGESLLSTYMELEQGFRLVEEHFPWMTFLWIPWNH
jgi:hypothetical protein